MNQIATLCLVFLLLRISSGLAQQAPARQQVKVVTPYGLIRIALYDATPQHRDNFVKQIAEGWFGQSDFHRVINNFVVQGGGHPDGREDPGYTIPAEVSPRLCHFRGAVGMAREADDVNPQRASSSSQFYIVHGKPVTDSILSLNEQRIGFLYTPSQRKTYLEKGGQPRLDGLYTVFGEVVEGMDVVDRIAAQPTGADDRPLEKIAISIHFINN